MTPDVNAARYLAGDLSGIQRFVLRVKTAGKAQAKRLRARSFLLELLEHAALRIIQERFRVMEDDVLIRGGGGFLVRVPADTDPAHLEQLDIELQRMLWREFGGEIQLALGWADSPLAARAQLERRKRQPGRAVLQRQGRWDLERWSQPPLDDPCQVCGQYPATKVVHDEEDDDDGVSHCASCLKARSIGAQLTRRQWIRAGRGPIRVLGVAFEMLESAQRDAWRVGRWIPRHDRHGGPLTFQELAQHARGDARLAVLKADVDDMGSRVGQIADSDSSCRQLRSFSRDLHAFFSERMQQLAIERWPLVYTLYAGGDDLLVVGPWNVVLDFAGDLAHTFRDGPGRTYAPLTLSAGITLTPYRVPVRRAVERAEELLESAKMQPGKSRCAALGADWPWSRHRAVTENGKRIAQSVETHGVPRGLLHRLLQLAESDAGRGREQRAARWAYQVARNVPRRNRGFHSWSQDVLGHLERSDHMAKESAASLRYALLATRTKGRT